MQTRDQVPLKRVRKRKTPKEVTMGEISIRLIAKEGVDGKAELFMALDTKIDKLSNGEKVAMVQSAIDLLKESLVGE